MVDRFNDTVRGFLFGMTLQLAIGPVCMYLLAIAATAGFTVAEAGVLGVALVDALYIGLSLAGVSCLLNRPQRRRIAGLCGCAIMALFGATMVMGGAARDAAVVRAALPGPGHHLAAFIGTALLTASNPLTIIFWTGVFGARMGDAAVRNESPVAFAAGCVGATLCFMTCVAAAGNVVGGFLQPQVLPLLSGAVGGFLLVFSLIKTAGLLRRPLSLPTTGG